MSHFQKPATTNMNDGRANTEKRDQYMVEVLSRLVDALNRSSEVMNSALNTIETLAHSPNKTKNPDDDSVLINSKRNDKVGFVVESHEFTFMIFCSFIVYMFLSLCNCLFSC